MDTNEASMIRKAFFNERAEAWLDKFYKNPETGVHDRYSEQISRIVSTLNIEQDSRVLDLGCGSGVLVPYLLSRLSRKGRLFEMDYAKNMIAANQKAHGDDRITFICSDVMDMPFGEAYFDSIICFACFPHFQDQKAALKKISRSLKTDHILTISHLMSSKEIAGHHSGETAVSRDRLPAGKEMEDFCKESKLSITKFIDEPGEYLLSVKKEISPNLF